MQLGDIDLVVAGGMESMSNAPYLLAKARELKLHDAEACGVLLVSGRVWFRQKLKLHEAKACGVSGPKKRFVR
ncbi:MAG TPA: hypothetical protein VMM84_08875 [Pyrinomonadaceae bacterium]|nr:hypothetical protein [Pyrinomonadaceae bacterium]